MSTSTECISRIRFGYTTFDDMAPRRSSPVSHENIADRLELTRKALKLNKTEFAKLAGINKQTYGNYIKLRRRPNYEQAENIMRGVGIDPNWLWHGDLSTMRHDLRIAIQAEISASQRTPKKRA